MSRVAFLYHYIPSLLLSLLAAGIAFDVLTARVAKRSIGAGCSVRHLVVALLLALALAAFAHLVPLYLGWPLELETMNERTKLLDIWA